MRKSFLFNNDQVDQLLGGLTYDETQHGIAFAECN